MIQWADSFAELATWEDEDDLLRMFSEFTAWGQAVANGGGDVMVRPADKLPSLRSPKLKRERRHSTRYAGPEWVTSRLVASGKSVVPTTTVSEE